MIFGGASLGSVALGSVTQDPGTIVDPTSLRPILTELNGVDFRAYVQIDTFSKQDTLGQPVSASITFLNAPTEPRAGDTVRVRFHESVEFAGTISRVRKRTPDLTQVFYDCELVDWSQILMRRQVRRNFTNMTVQDPSIRSPMAYGGGDATPVAIGSIEPSSSIVPRKRRRR